MPNAIQRMLGVEPDGVSMQTKRAMQEAGILNAQQPAPQPQPQGNPIMGSTVDPNATIVLPDGRRITPAQAEVLKALLRRRGQQGTAPAGR